MKEKLEARKKALEAETAKLEEEDKALVEKRREIDQRRSYIRDRFVASKRVINEIEEFLDVEWLSFWKSSTHRERLNQLYNPDSLRIMNAYYDFIEAE